MLSRATSLSTPAVATTSVGMVAVAAKHSAAMPHVAKPVHRTPDTSGLKQRFMEVVPPKRAEIAEFTKAHSETVVGTYNVGMVYGGMRDIQGLVTETSLLDSNEGIRFRGLSIPEIQARLPAAKNGTEPLPEGLFWLLLTGEVPTKGQVDGLIEELNHRSKVPQHVFQVIDTMAKAKVHPMTTFVAAISALQSESVFAKEYAMGINKNSYWDPMYEDSLNCIARLPSIAARIYRHTTGQNPDVAHPHLDLGANLAHMMGDKRDKFVDLVRLYLTIHSDHEGGNASAHTTHLVGSTLSDAYLSLAGGMTALAGPLHGLANQEVLNWLDEMIKSVGGTPVPDKKIEEYLWETIKAGRVVPGYGHAVLRKTDPRYMCQREFALKHLPEDPKFKVVSQMFEIAPKILGSLGKVKNPYPNVDAHSGVLLQHFNVTASDFYTVMFGVSRALGVLASLCWDRALSLPLERPKSNTTESLKAVVAANLAAKKV